HDLEREHGEAVDVRPDPQRDAVVLAPVVTRERAAQVHGREAVARGRRPVTVHVHVHAQRRHTAGPDIAERGERARAPELPCRRVRHVIQHAAREHGLVQPAELGGVLDLERQRHSGRLLRNGLGRGEGRRTGRGDGEGQGAGKDGGASKGEGAGEDDGAGSVVAAGVAAGAGPGLRRAAPARAGSGTRGSLHPWRLSPQPALLPRSTCRVDRPSTWRGSPRPALLPPSACARAAWCAPAGRGVAPLFRHRPAPSVWLLWIIRAQDPTTGCPGPGFYGRTHGRVKTGEEGRGASRWVAVTRPRTAALRAGGAQRGNARPAYSGGGVNRWVGGTAHPRPAAMAACGIQ